MDAETQGGQAAVGKEPTERSGSRQSGSNSRLTLSWPQQGPWKGFKRGQGQISPLWLLAAGVGWQRDKENAAVPER